MSLQRICFCSVQLIIVINFCFFRLRSCQATLDRAEVRLTAINISSLNLTWKTPTEINNASLTGYNITWDNSSDHHVDNHTTSYLITNLPTPGANYTAWLTAIYSLNGTESSDKVSATTNTYPDEPKQINVAERQTKQLSLSWTTSGVVEECYVWVKNLPNANSACTSPFNSTIISNLPEPGEEYNISIVLRSGNLNSSAVMVAENTFPEKATNITVVDRQTHQLNLSWTTVGKVDGCYVLVNETNSRFNCSTPFNSIVISNLQTAGENYTIGIVLTSGNLKSSEVTIIERTVPQNAMNITVVNRQTHQLKLSWTTVGEVDGCYVSVNASSFKYSCDSPFNSTTISNLPMAGAKYTIEIVLTSGTLNSSEANITTRTDVNAPLDVIVTNTTETQLQVQWNNSVGEYDGFEVLCIGIAYSSRNSSAIDVNHHSSAICENATAGILYGCTVTTYIKDESLKSISNTSYGVTVPLPPRNASATTINTTSVQLALNYGRRPEESQCTHYEIIYGSRTATVPCNQSVLSLPLTGLASDSLCNISVFAVSNYTVSSHHLSKTSLKSTDTQVWTLPDQVAKSRLTGNHSVTSSSIEVVFDRPSSHDHVQQYIVLVRNDTGYTQQLTIRCTNAGELQIGQVNCDNETADTKSNMSISCEREVKVNITNLRPYKNYSISIVAVNPGGCSEPSSNSTFTTAAAVPLCVNIVNRTSQSNSIEITWNEPLEPNGIITGYIVTYFSEETNETTIRTNVTRLNISDLHAYDNYTVRLAAVNQVGTGVYIGCSDSNITVQTKIGKPFPVTLTASALSSTSAKVNWTQIERRTAPETYYNLSIIDTFDSNTSNSTHVDGFSQRSVVITGLDEYWNYSVSAISYVIDEEGNALVTEGTNIVYFTTQEGPPGAVEAFSVSSLSYKNQCNASFITWNEPSLRQRNGIIRGYNVTWYKNGQNGREENTFLPQTTSATLAVMPDGQMYTFTIWAKTISSGTPKSAILDDTGSCYPSYEGNVDSVILGSSDASKSSSTTESFRVVFDLNYFTSNPNGALLLSGLLVQEDYGGLVSAELIGSLTDLYNKSMTWKTAVDKEVIPEYLATPENWLNAYTSKQAAAVSASSSQQASSQSYVIGNDDGCSKQQSTAHCNGPLPSNRKFRVRPIICTKRGCYIPPYPSIVFITAAKQDLGWIAAAVLIPIVVIVALAIVAYIILRRKGYINRRPPSSRRNPSSTTDDNVMDQAVGLTSPRVSPTPVDVERFPGHVMQMHCDSDLRFSDEYSEIQRLSPKHSWSEAERYENKTKNRFINILPFDSSRVILQTSGRQSQVQTEYINANYIPGESEAGEYIAAQGPLPSTLNDFWRMIWQEKVSVIVMLTNLKEKGRDKCSQYWPETIDEPKEFGSVLVTMESELANGFYVVRTLTAVQKNETREVVQYHYITFPDFGVPKDPVEMLDFVTTVRIHIGSHSKRPTIVHCSAGVGRTGTFIALDRLLRQIREFRKPQLDVYHLILQMRDYRCHMVQTEGQYVFIHDCIQLELTRNLTPGIDNSAYEMLEEPLYANQDQLQKVHQRESKAKSMNGFLPD